MKEYIERNALIAELEDDLVNDVNMYNSHIDKEIRDDKYAFAIEVLDSAPVADVREVVHAKWERKEYNSNYPYYRMECSNCGGRMPRNQLTKEYYSDYCPNCGAKMDAE